MFTTTSSNNDIIFVETGLPEIPPEDFKKDKSDIKKAMRFEQGGFATYVYVVAIHKDNDKNRMLDIPATSGDPLNMEVYDVVKDMYHLRGYDHHEIGQIPVSYTVYFKETEWQEYLPLPFSVIRRHMTDEQMSRYDEWRAKYKNTEFYFQFVQMLGVF